MGRGRAVALTIALLCVAVGGIITTFAFRAMNYDFKKLGTISTEEKVYKAEGDFRDVEISGISGDISFYLSENGETRVECTENEYMKYNVEAANNKLTIQQEDDGKWHDRIGINIDVEYYLRVYLPGDSYERLKITSMSGDVRVPGTISFRDIDINAVSGDIEIADQKPESLTVSTISGEITLQDTAVSGIASIETTSGDIELDRFDADTIDISSISGDIEGTLLSPKKFNADTISGEVKLPPTDNTAGECRIDTTSGDIEIRVI